MDPTNLSIMRKKVIKADTIDEAVEGILDELNRSRQNIIYFDGWDGLGAYPVLRAVAQRLALKEPTRPPGLNFELVIHIDCSKWESTRAVQREIAEQLKLSTRVMEMFDKQDEEDDFDGIIDQGSRMEVSEVAAEIQKSIQGRRFLLVLHNGSNEEMDISSLGLSLYGYLTNKMLRTFQGRFRMDTRMKDKAMKKNVTDSLLSADTRTMGDRQEFLSCLLHEEATQVACRHEISPAIVVECFLYMLKLHCIRGHHVDAEYDLVRHACNYWICDGIMQIITDSVAWQVGDALEGEIQLDMEYQYNDLPSDLLMYAKNMPYWTSPVYGFALVPAGIVPSGTFQHFDKLGVIKLSRCSFSFLSPPFRCCRSLRFLWLDHCQDLSTDAEEMEQDEDPTRPWPGFQSLWVLDLRFTGCKRILSARMLDLMTQLRELNVMGARYWDMSHLRGRLRNICKLRITVSFWPFNHLFSFDHLFSEMESLELLDVSENYFGPTSLSGTVSNSKLKTLIVSRAGDLKAISFRGCKELINLCLKGSFGKLQELDFSGTGVKTQDLSLILEFRRLPQRTILLGCEKLCTILWPQNLRNNWGPDVLLIDTTSTSSSAIGGQAEHAHPHGDQSLQQMKEEMFKGGWQISLADTRLLRSLSPVRNYFENSSLHIDICSAATVGHSNVQETNSYKYVQVQPHASTIMASQYNDVLKDGPFSTIMMWDCPRISPRSYGWRSIVKVIMPGQGKKHLEGATGASTISFPDFICDEAISLHVYDNSSITSIPAPPQGLKWKCLEWCRVERCPKLHTVFTFPQGSTTSSFSRLRALWVSQLLTACYIMDRTLDSSSPTFLHVDCCPRLLHVLPTDELIPYILVTLEIVYCGDLREVFPLGCENEKQDGVLQFFSLRRIHLHELPKLQHICRLRMRAPKLETVKIRGCWSLKRLPTVGDNTKPPKVDCEKEWWDNLQWDGLDKYHHPSLYQPSHSLYYKAQLPRVSVLR